MVTAEMQMGGEIAESRFRPEPNVRGVDERSKSTGQKQTLRLREIIDTEWRTRAIALLDQSDQAEPRRGLRLLEIGCGNGELTLALAERGYEIDAVDPSAARLQKACQKLNRTMIARNVRFHTGECDELPFDSESFDHVVVHTAMSWAPGLERALSEIARILKPGRRVLFGAENKRSCSLLLGRGRQAAGHPSLLPRRYCFSEITRILRQHSLQIVETRTIGFGPFFVMGRRVPEWAGKLIHEALQSAERYDIPILRGGGSRYLVLAVKEPAGRFVM